MTQLKAACVQMRAKTEIDPNIADASALIREAAANGAQLVATPEMTNLLDIRRGQAKGKLVKQAEDRSVRAFSELARELEIWLLIGSVAVRHDGDPRASNRSLLFEPTGKVAARYDKIHMFDVDVDDGQSYRESRSYRPGDVAVLAETPLGKIGMSICYDVRFPHLYRTLAQAGAEILTVPAAFTKVTGAAHWHTLLKARAIETGCFVLAPAQGGKHEDGRETFGHSLIIAPWGEVLADSAGIEPGVIYADLDLAKVADARRRIPSLGLDVEMPLSRV
ncbi:MAG: carbon-nitrogen hydrolase family protein [Pseudomonadota bacterium]